MATGRLHRETRVASSQHRDTPRRHNFTRPDEPDARWTPTMPPEAFPSNARPQWYGQHGELGGRLPYPWQPQRAAGIRSQTAAGSVSKRTWSHPLAREDPHHTYRRGMRLARTAYPEIRRHVLGPTRQET